MALQPTARIRRLGKRTPRPGKQAVWDALAGLTSGDFRTLATFAARQLGRMGLPAGTAEDIVQQALLTLAVGAGNGSRGRHPQPGDLADHGAFLNYLRGILSSLIDSQRKLRENRFAHTRWEDGQMRLSLHPGFSTGHNVSAEVAFNDLTELLYTRLSRRVPAWLRPPLNAWREQHFQSEQIPLDGAHRQLRLELRLLAAQVLSELGEFSANDTTPKVT